LAERCFVTLFLLWGSCYNRFGVFFTPLLKEFHGTHASISLCATAIVLFTGAGAPLAGWLVKLVDVRIVMALGATLAGISLIGISNATSFSHLLGWYVSLGIGLGGSTMVPASLVITNWFKERRGTVLGVATAGMELGGVIMTLLSAHLITTRGWRTAGPHLRDCPAPDSHSCENPSRNEGSRRYRRSDPARGWIGGAGGFPKTFVLAARISPALLWHRSRRRLGAHGAVDAQGRVLGSNRDAGAEFGARPDNVGKPTMGVLGDYIGARKALSAALAVCALGILLMGDAKFPMSGLHPVMLYGFMLVTLDSDFDHIAELTVYKPTDL